MPETIKELEEYFGREADNNTIYADRVISPEDEIVIGNICYEHNVHYAIGTYTVTIYAE